MFVNCSRTIRLWFKVSAKNGFLIIIIIFWAGVYNCKKEFHLKKATPIKLIY